MSEENSIDEVSFTKEEVMAFVKDIELKLVGGTAANLHSVVAINRIMRASNINELLDSDLKERIKDIWIKLKSTGIQLLDPPIIFGLPKDFDAMMAGEIESEDVPELGEDPIVEEEEEALASEDLPAIKKPRKKKEDKREQIN